jgi:hypothetical protein
MKLLYPFILLSIFAAFPAVPEQPRTDTTSVNQRSPVPHTGLSRPGDGGVLFAQYLTEDREYPEKKEKAREALGPYAVRKKTRFIAGIFGSLSSREKFAVVSAAGMFGIGVDRFSVYMNPEFLYTRTRSLKSKNLLLRTTSSAEVMEFGLPVKCAYSFFDTAEYPYTPYVEAGVGYNFRKYSASGSSTISRVGVGNLIHSLTLNYGFGFIVRTTERTRFKAGLGGISYFNTIPGKFSYDTTGASAMFGFIVIFD